MSKIPLLFQLLTERHISQTKLSKDTGLSLGAISDWKSGRSKPSHSAIKTLCEYLALPLDYFDDDKTKNAPITVDESELFNYLKQTYSTEELKEFASLPRDKAVEIVKQAKKLHSE